MAASWGLVFVHVQYKTSIVWLQVEARVTSVCQTGAFILVSALLDESILEWRDSNLLPPAICRTAGIP